MARLFVSYARKDLPVVVQLVSELREMGHEPFYDQDLTGGQRWWEVLLQRIEDSDGFLPVLSEAYIDSEACRLESRWAADVGVPILPLDLGRIGPEMCDPHVAQTNWIRYGLEDRSSIARLARALGALPPRTPPAQPPVRPAVPVTYLTATRQEIHDTEMMSIERQLAIVSTLRTKLGTEDDSSARTLLTELRRRPDIGYTTAVEIDTMLGAGSASVPSRQPPEEGGRGRRPLVAAGAVAAVLVVALGTSWAVTHLGGDDDGDGGSSPAAGAAQGQSMSESMPGSTSESTSGSAAASSETDELISILQQVDEQSKHGSLIPPGTCAAVAADEVSCSPGVSGVSSVDFHLYDSVEELYAEYMSMAAESSGGSFDEITNTGECDPKHFSGEVSWNHNRHHSTHYSVEDMYDPHLNDANQAAGRVFCDLHGTALTMIWTQNHGPTFVAVAEGAPHDDVGAWWRQVHHLIACLGTGMCADVGGMDASPSSDPGSDPSGEMSTDPSDGMSGMG